MRIDCGAAGRQRRRSRELRDLRPTLGPSSCGCRAARRHRQNEAINRRDERRILRCCAGDGRVWHQMKKLAFDIRAIIRPDLLDLPGYVPITPSDVLAERLGIAADDVIKLDGNENPFGPSPKALEAIRNEPNYHIYPDPDQRKVREALASYL